MSNTLKVTLVKSLIGRKPKHILMARQLGLRKLNAVVNIQDNACTRGLLSKIDYLVCVQECK